MSVGVERIGVYGGRAFLDVKRLAAARGLDGVRFDNLLMRRKTVSLHFEDPVSFAVNAGERALAGLSASDRATVELVIVATESGIDFGKSISTYVHHYLGLGRECRLFEIKQACYGGTAALQMAAASIQTAPGRNPRALVICTDVARPVPHTYAETSQGAAAVALLISREPTIFALEPGASGVWGYEVMDACRPSPDVETGNADLSLLTYLECLERSFEAFQRRVGPVDFQEHFDGLAFHTPFGGMVKGAHRTMMRKLKRAPPAQIEEDYVRRVQPSLAYCQDVGNIYSGAVFLALCGLIDRVASTGRRRVGVFSYGSGCCSEFYSGIVGDAAPRALAAAQIRRDLDDRRELSMPEYERLLGLNQAAMFGACELTPSTAEFADVYRDCFAGRGVLVLKQIRNYHREYVWS